MDLQPGDEVAHLVGRTPDAARDASPSATRRARAPGRTLLPAERPDVALLLGEVDEKEVRGEGAGETLEAIRIEVAEESISSSRTTGSSARRREIVARRTAPPVEQLASLLLDEHLAQQGAEEPHLPPKRSRADAEPVPRARRGRPGWLERQGGA